MFIEVKDENSGNTCAVNVNQIHFIKNRGASRCVIVTADNLIYVAESYDDVCNKIKEVTH